MTTTIDTTQIVNDALEIATDHGIRAWREDYEAVITSNDFGGYDLSVKATGRTYRVTEDDGTFGYYVFTGGRAMLLAEKATFTAGLSWLISTAIGEALR